MQFVAQPMLLCSYVSMLEKFGEDRDQFWTFTAQCEMVMTSRLVELPTDHTDIWLKEVAAKWAIFFIEGNVLMLDRDQDFM